MQQHTIHFWTPFVGLCSLEQEDDVTVLVGKFCRQTLAFSGFMVLSRQLGTWKQQGQGDFQVGAPERGQCYRLGIPSWMSRFFSRVASCL